MCCGGSRRKTIKRRLLRIIEGFGRLAIDSIFGSVLGDVVSRRLVACSLCDYHTFLSILQWGRGAITEGDLPINHTYRPGDTLWCAVCKCCIEAKIRVRGEECLKDRWDI